MGAVTGRRVVGKIMAGLCGVALVLGCAANAQAQQEEKVLNIYNWSDYIGPDVIKNFEKGNRDQGSLRQL